MKRTTTVKNLTLFSFFFLGGGGALWSPIGFSYAASPGTQLVAMATLLLRGFRAHLRKITKKSPIST